LALYFWGGLQMPQQRPGGKLPTSFHLTAEAKRILKALAEKLGSPQSAILERLIRTEGRKEKVE
jgi:predicted DNA-binding protein